MSKVKCLKSVDNFKRGKFYEVFIEFDNSYWIYDKNFDEIKFYKKTVFAHNLIFSEYFDDVQKSRHEKLKKLYDTKTDNC